MSFRSSSLITLGILILLVAFVLVPQSKAQIPDFEIRVGDTTAFPGKTNSVISVFLTNRVDSIAAYTLWLNFDRPDIMIFQQDTLTVEDTNYYICNSYFGEDCVDSTEVLNPDIADLIHPYTKLDTIGNIDTTGTLSSGWELVDSRSTSGTGADILIVGLADDPSTPGVTPGIPPSFSGGLLIKILADVFYVPDTLTDRTVDILVQTNFLYNFSLSDPSGNSLGKIQVEMPDTTCFYCTNWVGDECFNYIPITFGDCDSIEVVLDTIPMIDTTNVKIFDGSLTVLPGAVCGNLDGVVDPVMEIDIADLVYFVDYLFNDGAAPDPAYIANFNCDVEDGDIADLVMMVDWLFNNGPPICTCWGQ